MRVLGLVLIALLPSPQDKGARRLEWKLARGRVAEYAVLDKSGKPVADRSFYIFGSELVAEGNRLAIDKCRDLPLPLLFQLPPKEFKGALQWDHTVSFFHETAAGGAGSFFGLGGFRPLCAKGRYVLRALQKKGDDEIAVIDGSFSFFEIRRDYVNNQLSLNVTKNDFGTLVTSAQVSVPRGLLLKGAFQLKLRGQERVLDQGESRVVDAPLSIHEIIELKEDYELEPAKMNAAIETSIKKAMDALRRKQAAGGSWGSARTLESPRVAADSTGLVVRALLAAGIKADDRAIVSSSAVLRAPASSTQGASHALVALALKGPSAEETAAIKTLAEDLMQKRDPRTGTWSSGARNAGGNPLSTAHAIEALAHAAVAKIPDEVWRAALDHFTTTWTEETREIQLNIEFEKDAATIDPEPKKVFPGSWPLGAARRQDTDPLQIGPRVGGGSSLTALAALKTLLIASERMKLDDKQKRALDTSLRKGLGYLQLHWTLRTVPPTEAAWCRQRAEYLGLLSQVLVRAKVDRIAGSDWRLEGAFVLMKDQQADGSWDYGNGVSALETANALLFLAAARR